MLPAHLVPGYFAAVNSREKWRPEWSRRQRALLWAVALSSTSLIPDFDVIYNFLVHGRFVHSTLWTHSLFPHLGVALVWWLLKRGGRWPYLQTLVGLAAVGGLSHLLLDVIAHSTPLFYPVSMVMVGAPSEHVLERGLWGYLTDPILLLEPLLFFLAAAHWTVTSNLSQHTRQLIVGVLFGVLVLFSGLYLLLLPGLRALVSAA